MSARQALGVVAVLVIAVLGIRLATTPTHHDKATASQAPSTAIAPIATSSAAPASPLPTATATNPTTASPLPTAAATVTLPDARKVAQPTVSAGSVAPVDTSTVDMTSADAVADLFAQTAATSDTATDFSWADAQRRASAVMTKELVDQTMAAIPGGQDAQWSALVAHRGYTKASVREGLDDLPTDSPTQAFRVRVATRTASGRDGWSGPVDQIAYFLTLTRVDGSWLVSAVQASSYSGK